MLELGMANILLFVLIVGIAGIFITAWMVSSESMISISKKEIKKLKARLESSEKEKFELSEKIDRLEGQAQITQDIPPELAGQKKGNRELMLQILDQNKALEKKNKHLEDELAHAKSSLDEIYKAITERESGS